MTKKGELSLTAKKNAARGGVAALALAAMVAIVPVWEGRSLTPYRDVGGVWTVCDGETEVQMRTYTPAECDAITARRLVEFRDQVATLNPAIRAKPMQWAAHASFAYNVGIGAYARSSVLRLFRAGQEASACRAIGKYIYAKGKVYRGLVLRRQGDAARLGEVELCLS